MSEDQTTASFAPDGGLSVGLVVPNVPPTVCGVYDYACGLVSHLSGVTGSEGISARFYTPKSSSSESISGGSCKSDDDASVRALPVEELSQWVDALARHQITLVMYSGYGFDPSGAPKWLASVCEQLPVPFLLHVHEAFAAESPLLSRARVHLRSQKQVLARLVASARGVLTSSEEYRRLIQEVQVDSPTVTVLPIPSNFGEPELEAVVSTSEQRVLLVAGGKASRELLYYNPEFRQMLNTYAVTRIVDVGPQCEQPDDLPCELQGFGLIEPAEFTAIASAASFAALCYSVRHLPTSGVFAAYTAHGLPVVVIPREGKCDSADLHFIERHPFISFVAGSEPPQARWYKSGVKAFHWYHQNGWRAHASWYFDQIRSSSQNL